MTLTPPAGREGKLAVLDLFSGIGAYSLGLERTGGFETVALCEINAFCRRNLNQHWPHVASFDDVKELTGKRLRDAGIVPDWIVAGWPCQGNSPAGTGLGMDDPRSGLWSEIRRLAGEIRPRGLLLENSSNLLSINGGADFGAVLGDLATLGFDAEWHCLPAAAFDAPHIRDRVWIIATLADHARNGRSGEPAGQQGRLVADGDDPLTDAYSLAPVGVAIARQERVSWQSIADFRGVVHGDAQGLDGFAVTTEPVPDRVERIHALGNLNPPIIPESIGRAILSVYRPRSEAA